MANKVTSFQIVDHGIDGGQYFPGCGVMFTEYDECVTGANSSAVEALCDAIEAARQNGAEFTEEETESMLADITETPREEVPEGAGDLYYYVSIRYCVESSQEASK